MANGTVVIVGDLPIEHLGLDLLVAEFGWSLKKVEDLDDLQTFGGNCDPVTVLFGPKILALSWAKALNRVMAAAPRALPIVCHGFGERLDLSEVAEAGAFHTLLLPFSVSEVRQSLGFVWCAKRLRTRILPQLVPQRHQRISRRTSRQIHVVA